MPATMRPPAPIAIIGFNRPQYFREVLASLVAQQSARLDEREIVLFHDNALNPHSGQLRAEPADIEASMAVFREFLPGRKIMLAEGNVGVALNFDRAERWAFEELQAEACIFLEDDMVLSPHYIAVLDRMLDMAAADPRIGYVGAFGDWGRPLAQQQEAPGRLIVLRQNWAFGLTRAQWLKNRPFVEQYLSLVRDIDYRQRPTRDILDLYSAYGMQRAESSQDRAKFIACVLTGGLRVNTTACLARYIGRVGLHATEAMFVRSGFDQTELFPTGDFAIETLTDERYAELLAAQSDMVAAPFAPVEIGKKLAFGHGGRGVRALRAGFYGPEDWGAWSASERSEVAIRLPPVPEGQRHVLEFGARHHLPPSIPLVTVDVTANGQPAGALVLSRSQTRVQLPLTPEAAREDGELLLGFRSPVVGSPRRFGTGTDDRALSLGLSDVTLLTVPDED